MIAFGHIGHFSGSLDKMRLVSNAVRRSCAQRCSSVESGRYLSPEELEYMSAEKDAA
mgnify:CR=1 FL=1